MKMDSLNKLYPKGVLNTSTFWDKFKKGETPEEFFERMIPVYFPKPVESADEYLTVFNCKSLNVRETPGGKWKAKLKSGEIVKKLSKSAHGWYEIQDDDITGWVYGSYVKKTTVTMAKIQKGYSTFRRSGSKVHVLEVDPKDFIIDVSMGTRYKNETVSATTTDPKLEKYGEYELVAATNAGFFGGGREHLGTYVDEGYYYYPPNKTFIDFIYYKDGTTEVKYIEDLKEVARLQKSAFWAIGTSWSLVINGTKDLIGTSKISHSRSRQPRTLLSQRKDGKFLLIVIEGRGKNFSLGMTASQCADLLVFLNAWNGVNLDGGGSSQMNVGTAVKNDPTDGVERKVGSTIRVYAKK